VVDAGGGGVVVTLSWPASTKPSMSDDLKKREPQDGKRVNVHETWEVDYWCKKVGCTKEQLVAAVKLAGPMVDDVRRQLGKK
jgi:Protein of unknown function (DUF3606)